jgi:hypothetical protein
MPYDKSQLRFAPHRLDVRQRVLTPTSEAVSLPVKLLKF